MNRELTFRDLAPSDWAQVARIYAEGLDTGNATFETKVPSWVIWDDGHVRDGRIVAAIEQEVVGWCALSPVSSRCVYGGVAEVSVYVSKYHQGLKIGTKLLERLISESEKMGIWTLQASIFPENKASITLHKNLGFREIGYREKIGKHNGVWRDTVWFERRSSNIGID